MVYAKAAISFIRLLNQCETLACQDSSPQWQMDQFVLELEERYSYLLTAPNHCGMATAELADCQKRVDYLRSTVPRMVGVFPTPLSSLSATAAAPTDAPSSPSVTPATPDSVFLPSQSAPPSLPQVSVATSHAPPAAAATVAMATGALHSPSLRFRHNVRRQLDQRRQLLSERPANAAAGAADTSDAAGVGFDGLMQKHRRLQEEATEQLLLLTRSLKEQSKLASTVVNRDRETLERSSGQAERNRARLNVQSSRLRQLNARWCRCWLWTMLAVVCVTFIGTVVFIRIFRK